MSYTKTTTHITTGPGGRTTKTTTVTRGGGGDRQAGGGGQRVAPAPIRPQAQAPTETRRKKEEAMAPKQDYQKLKAECLSSGTLFEDPEFPAIDTSIFYSKRPPRPFVWKRPPEICENPRMFVGGASRFDIKQGELGDCWLLAAVASLSMHKDLLYRVVPQDQSFVDNYAGIFHFQFWQYGKWVDVVVDDRLPTYYDRLVFLHSEENNEFWTALLEKAYAKLMGSYESLKGGSSSEAMEDFTGGVTEFFDLRKENDNLFNIMIKAQARTSLMGCSIDADPSQLEAELPNGLIMGHAYSITAVKLVDIATMRTSGKIPLVRIRNPWGNECEWKGAWSDKSREWQLINEAERNEIGLSFDDDGEFWMSFKDFMSNFQKLEICNLGPDSLQEDTLGGKSKKRWEATMQNGSWVRRVSAGGCRNYLDTFWTNPQFRVTVTDPDDDDEDNTCTILIALMQAGRRKKRKEGLDLLTMGYAVYQVKDTSAGMLDMDFFKYNASFAKSPTFINLREICGRHKLPPGTYAIIPSTFEPQKEGDFLVRIYTEKANTSETTDEQTSMEDVESRYKVKPLPSREVGTGDVITASSAGLASSAPPGGVGQTPKEVAGQIDANKEALRERFRLVAGEDMEIDAYELQNILNMAFKKEREDFKFPGFSTETCRSMVAMKDSDRSAMLGFDEFQELWQDLLQWKNAFKKFDKDKSGTFNSYELRAAFKSVGITLSNQTFSALVMRYARRDGLIEFDDFIHCAVKLKSMIQCHREHKAGKTSEFDLDDFIMCTMYS